MNSPTSLNKQSYRLDKTLWNAVMSLADRWRTADNVGRLWRGDAALWTDSGEGDWLGWLDVVDDQLERLGPLQALCDVARLDGFTDVLLLGMGGSSLGPEVLAKTLGSRKACAGLHVLDSTDPVQITRVQREINLDRTLFIVSSKSGTTFETNILRQYFFECVVERFGREAAGSLFIAVTDSGSKLQHIAERDGFRAVFLGVPSIGGRYSVLSNFGMVPAAASGFDVCKLLGSARVMAQACAANVPPVDNPGVMLGLVMGQLASYGRNKITLIASPNIVEFGAWAEQLIAESTCKHGKGLIPIDQEPLGKPFVYSDDRMFVYLRLDKGANPRQDVAVEALEKTGQPVVRIALSTPEHIAQEFFRWELAVAVAGAVIGINPFDQPDVEASKVKTRELIAAYDKTGDLPEETPVLVDGGLVLYADQRNARALRERGGSDSLESYLGAHLDQLGAGDYFAILAYVDRNSLHTEMLQRLRQMVRDSKQVASCHGFGPRFLHSTGQAYKGGPNSGVFLQITCDDAVDLAVPGQSYSFGTVKAAQARGDFEVLAKCGRRALRVHLGPDVAAGLAAIEAAFRQALK